jgi:DMSO/TMAO reductase YedYZ molybdopterin-dependent catalytic subunit
MYSVAAMAEDAPAPAGPAASGDPATIRLGGAVEHPKTYTIDDLRRLPATKEYVAISTGHGPVSASYTGVLLWDLLNDATIRVNAAVKGDILRKYLVAVGHDGYQVVLSLGEVIPEFGAQQVIVAYAENGASIGRGAGTIRLIVPGDKRGGRDVLDLEHVDIREAQSGE